MDELGLGTKATRADIINKLVSRYYIHGNPLQPTKTAYAVVDTLEKYSPSIVNPDMTRRLEEDMDKISDGSIAEEAVLSESRELLSDIFNELEKNNEQISQSLRTGLIEDKTVGKCQICGSDLTIRKSRKGSRFIGCNGYPDCTFSIPLPKTGQVVVTDKMCDEHQMYKIKIVTEGKRPWELGCPKCNFLEWEQKQKELEQEDPEAFRRKRAGISKLSDISGLGQVSLKKLNDAGIETIDDLISADSGALAEETKISIKNIEKWKGAVSS